MKTNKTKKLIFGLAAAALLFGAAGTASYSILRSESFISAYAESVTSSLVFTAKCNGSGTADDGAVWTITSDGTESNFDADRGIHYGTNSAEVTYIELSTSDIEGTITQVVVNACDARAEATISVTVGGEAFTGNSTTATSSAANYTFTGSGSGEVVVRIARASKKTKALYVKSVAVSREASLSPLASLTLTGCPESLDEEGTATLGYTGVREDTTSWAGQVTYQSSDPTVASIEGNVLTALKPGTTQITVAHETVTSSPVTLTVVAVPTKTFTLVESAQDLVVDGHYLITSAKEGDVVAMSKTQGDNNRPGISGLSVQDGAISFKNSNAEILTLGGEEGAYTLYANQSETKGYLYASSSSGNQLKTEAEVDDNGKWDIAIDAESVVTLTAQGTNTRNVMRFNPNNGNTPLFACYASSSTTGNKPYLFKLEEDSKVVKDEGLHVEAPSAVESAGEWTAEADLTYRVDYSDDSSDYRVNISCSAQSGISIVDDKAGTAKLTFTANGTYEVVVATKAKNAQGNVVSATKTIVVSGIPAVTLDSIAIKTNPTKMSYKKDQALDLSGLVITATYNNGRTEDLTEGYTSDPASGYVFTEDDLTVGKKTITITYEGKTTTFDVTVASVTGLIPSGRYFICHESNALNNKLIYSGTAPKAVDISKAVAWTFDLVEDNRYTISFRDEGVNTYLGSIDDSKGLLTRDSAEQWEITAGADGKYVLTGEHGRDITFYASGSDWRTYQSSNATGVHELSVLPEKEVFDSNFLNTFTSGCNPNGGYDAQELGQGWDDAKNQFDSLAEGLKTEYATASSESSPVLARYDYILNKYTTAVFEDFMHRFDGGSQGNFAGTRSMTKGNDIAVVVVATTLSVGFAGGLLAFALRKKKKN